MNGGDKKYAEIFSRKTQKKIPLGRFRRKLEDNIKIISKKDGADWIQLAQDMAQATVSFSSTVIREIRYSCVLFSGKHMYEGIQKFPDWPSGARTANGTAVCH
jgi:hypothetical protein